MDVKFSQDFGSILKLLSNSLSAEKHFRISEPSIELQKELKISEMETKLNGEIDRCKMLENRIFAMEKQLCVLKNSQNNNEINESPSKRHRVENDRNEPSKEIENTNQELIAKYSVALVELEELKRISKNHLNELNSLQAENIKLLDDVESKKDQV